MGFLDFLPGIGTLVKGAIGMGSSALGYSYNKKLMQAQQRYNTSERLATQQYNTSEREAAQAYNTGEREAQNAHAEQMYNTYSSPQALVRQFSDAGLNPRLAVDGGSVGSIQANSGSSASISPQSSGMLGITPPYQDVNSFSQGFVNIANALKSIAEAKKSGVETTSLQKFMDEQLTGLKLENRAKELGNIILSAQSGVIDKKVDAELRKLLSDVANGEATTDQIRQVTDNLKKEGKLKDFELSTWFKKFDADLAHLNASTANLNADTDVKKDEHALFAEKQSLMRATIRKFNSEAEKDKAITAYQRAATALVDFDNYVNSYNGPLDGPDWERLSRKARSLIKTYEETAKQAGFESEIKGYERDQALSDAIRKGYEAEYAKDNMGSGLVGDAATACYRLYRRFSGDVSDISRGSSSD